MLHRPASSTPAVALAIFAVAIVAGVGRLAAHDRPTGPLHKTRSSVRAKHGMAATSQPLATGAAIRVLQEGGNAIDAAIAANAVMGVVEPQSCGIGGDLFAIVSDATTGRLYGLNANGWAPRALTPARLKSQGLTEMPSNGIHTVTVPGAVAGWEALRTRLGTLPMSDLLAAAIAYADEGFPVSDVIAAHWAALAGTL